MPIKKRKTMKIRTRLLPLVIIAIIILILTFPAIEKIITGFIVNLPSLMIEEGSDSQSTSEWRMFRRGLEHTGYYPGNGPTTNATLWISSSIGSNLDSSPAVVNNVLYIGSPVTTYPGCCNPLCNNNCYHTNLYAFNANNGIAIWNYTVGSGNGVNVQSSPAVANGMVYFGSSAYVYDAGIDDFRFLFFALNATNGTYIWNFTSLGGGIVSSPAVVNNVVYIGAKDNKFYALNATNGAQIWNFSTGGVVDSSPAVANNIVYVGSADNNLYALNANDGIEIWNFSTGGEVYSSPAVANGLVYFGSADNLLYAVNSINGTQIWNYSSEGSIYSSPAVANGLVYFGSDDTNAYALNATNGIKIWNYSAGDAIESSPAVANGLVYFGSFDYNIYALDAANGIKIWEYQTGNAIYYSSPVIYNRILYIASSDGKVYAFKTNSAPTSSNPVLNSTLGANGTNENLTCSPQNLSDMDNDAVYPVFNWMKNNAPLADLNMPFDLNSSSSVKDYSGRNNNGVNHGATWIAGKAGGAYHLDGIDDYIEVPNNESLNFGTNDFSISLWVKENGNNNDLPIIDKGSGAPANDWYLSTIYGIFSFGIGNGTESDRIESLTNIGDNNWHNLVITKNTAEGKYHLYLDGINDLNPSAGSGETITFMGAVSNNQSFFVGAWSDPPVNWFYNGSVDEIKIYHYSLSAAQVYQIYLEENNSLNTSTIVSQETEIGDVFKCQVTPNDLMADGSTLNSNNLTIIDNLPIVNLISPANATSTDYTSFNFSCSATDDVALANITLYIWNSAGSLNYTNTTAISGTFNETNWSIALSIGSYEWNCLAYDNTVNPDWNDKNWTLNIISSTPFCGDGICNNLENCSTCFTDCGYCGSSLIGGGSSGGGGGGGGAPAEEILPAPTIEVFSLNEFESFEQSREIFLTASENTVIEIEIQTLNAVENHTVTVTAINIADGIVNLEIASESFYIILRVNETKKIDFNNDNLNDLEITLLGFSDGKANLSFKKPAACGNSVCESGEQPNCCKDCGCAEGECVGNMCQKKEPVASEKIIVILAAAFLLAAIVMSRLILKKNKKQIKKREKRKNSKKSKKKNKK